jgi:hypothetical protein
VHAICQLSNSDEVEASSHGDTLRVELFFTISNADSDSMHVELIETIDAEERTEAAREVVPFLPLFLVKKPIVPAMLLLTFRGKKKGYGFKLFLFRLLQTVTDSGSSPGSELL